MTLLSTPLGYPLVNFGGSPPLENRGGLSLINDPGGAPEPPVEPMAPIATHFPSVVVWDATEDQYLYEQDADNSGRQIYSLTKLLTGLTALDFLSPLTATMTIIADDLVPTPVWMPLQTGDVISFEDLLKGILIQEAGDASKALCRAIGDAAYAAAGNTGTSGFTRGMEEISAKAQALGLTSFVLTTPGGYEQFTNTGTPRDIAKLAWFARQDATLQPLTIANSGTATVTGANARSISLTDQAPYDRSGTLLDHVGYFEIPGSGFYRSNYVIVWTAPNGSELVILGVNSNSDRTYHAVDMDKLRHAVVRDFTYLDPSLTMSPADANWSSVHFMLGADTAIADETPTPETLTEIGTITRVASPRLIGSHSLQVANGNNYLQIDPPFGGLAGFFNEANFTIDMFVRIDTGGGGHGAVKSLLGQWGATNAEQSILLYLNSNNLTLQARTSAGTFVGPWAVATTPRDWAAGSHHICIQRSASGIRYFYFNGRRSANGTSATLQTPSTPIFIGANFTPSMAVDEVRFSKIARWPVGGWTVGSENGAVAKFPRS